ncbi:MAG: DUF4347 domain-containing protein [Cyanobacteria bacterium]|nr:DUF4347 domain-containing protein [Cyanobacteriota bacterium]MDW8201413.1 DUF4347 domain-containing protein [Cyanobacteriota bacterium SKYGB_h_bin112]
MARDPLMKCLVFVDAAVTDCQHFLQSAADNTEVVVLAGDRSGVEQMTAALQRHPEVDQVHVVSHGAPGKLYLGNESLSLANLATYQSRIADWFSQPATLFLYGCNVAAGDQGMLFLQSLHELTGAAIAASDDRTGNAALGGDWDLEVTIGDVTPSLAFHPEALKSYSGVLGTFDVPAGDVAALIAAIDSANSNPDDASTINLAGGTYTLTTFAPGTDTFQFPVGFFYGRTGLPRITTTITINGNGATIKREADPDNPFRLFLVDGNSTSAAGNLTLNNLTLTGGRTEDTAARPAGIHDDGGAIANYRGSLTVNNVTFTNNSASDDGGAILNLEGNATIANSTFNNNTAGDGGGAIENDGGGAGLPDSVLVVTNSNFTANTANQGGAIRNRNNSTLDITGGTIQNNTATGGGGGIFNSDSSVSNVVGTSFTNNQSPAGTPNNFGGTTVTAVSLASAGTPSEQGSVPGTFTITLDSPAPAGGAVFEFSVGGTATLTADYTVTGATTFTGTNGTVTVAGGATTATITITPVDDAVFDPNETVQLALTGGPNAGGGRAYTISNTPATLTILDNDAPPIGNNPTLSQVSPNVFLVGGTGGNLSFTLNQRSAAFINELGVFLVDDDAGTVGGLAPGSAGYVNAALSPARRNVIYSVLDPARSGTLTSLTDFTRELRYAAGSRLRFYIVSNSTTDAVLAGQTPASQVLFGVPANLQVTAQGANRFVLRFEDSVDADFNDLEVTVSTNTNGALVRGTTFQGVREVVDLTGTGNGRAVIVASEAAFNNTIGFYAVDDALTGRITTANGVFNPGDANYAREAVLNRVDINNMTAGRIYAPFIISNNTAQGFLAAPNQVNAFFAYLAANVDGRDHIRLLGSNLFGFEDQLGGGDNDFNDAIVRVTIS